MTEVARATVTIIPNMSGSQGIIAKELTTELGGASGAAAAAGKKAGGLFAGGIGGALKKVLPAIGLAEIGKQLFSLGKEFQEVEQIIVTGTGASGDALAGLVQSTKNVAAVVPASFTDVADTIQDLNTRMGLTGETLDNVARKVQEVGAITGSAVDLDKMTGAFNAFGVAGEDAAEKMDYLFGVSQNTGIGFNDLTGIVERNAPALRGLGFSFEEAANMAGLLDKAGIDASGTMSKLSKGLVELAQDGEEPADAFNRIVEEMDTLIKQGDTAAAIDLAKGIFGTRGAVQFVGAVESGAMSLDELKNAALGAGSGIDETMQTTMTFDQKLDVLGNKAGVVFEPLGSFLTDVLIAAFDALGYVMDSVRIAAEAFGNTGQWIAQAWEGSLQFIGSIPDDIGAAFEIAKDAVLTAWNVIVGFFTQVVNGIKAQFNLARANIIAAFTNAANFVRSIPGRIIGFFTGVAARIGAFFNQVKTNITNAFSNAASFVSSIPGRIVGFFAGIGGRVAAHFTSVVSGIKNKFTEVVNFVKGIPGKIVGFFSGMKISLPKIKLPHFKLSGTFDPLQGKLPSLGIDWYARGGIATGVSLIGVGEAGNEAIVPLSNPYMTPFAEAVAEEMPARDDGARMVIQWLNANLGRTIEAYAPTATPREFGRMVRSSLA